MNCITELTSYPCPDDQTEFEHWIVYDLASVRVACCMTALKDITMQLDKVLITGLGQEIILSIRVYHFKTLPHGDNFNSSNFVS